MAELLSESEASNEWIQRDPEAALLAISPHLSEGNSQFVSDAVEHWVEHEPSRAAEYIDREYPDPGPARDAAVSSLVLGIQNSDREAALRWAETITDEARRDEVIEQVSGEEE